MFTYLPIPPNNSVPEGFRLVVAYAKGDTVLLPIDANAVPEELHNCKIEKCSYPSHCVRFSVSDKYESLDVS
jgi:hypothetical protein